MVTSSCLKDDTSQSYMFTSHKHYTQWNIEYYIIYPSFPPKKKSCWEWKCPLIMSCQVPTVPTSCCGFKLFTLSLTMSDWSKRKEPEFPELWLTGHHVHSATSLYISICIYIYTYLFPIMPKYVKVCPALVLLTPCQICFTYHLDRPNLRFKSWFPEQNWIHWGNIILEWLEYMEMWKKSS
jgi:hypothetical protein